MHRIFFEIVVYEKMRVAYIYFNGVMRLLRKPNTQEK